MLWIHSHSLAWEHFYRFGSSFRVPLLKKKRKKNWHSKITWRLFCLTWAYQTAFGFSSFSWDPWWIRGWNLHSSPFSIFQRGSINGSDRDCGAHRSQKLEIYGYGPFHMYLEIQDRSTTQIWSVAVLGLGSISTGSDRPVHPWNYQCYFAAHFSAVQSMRSISNLAKTVAFPSKVLPLYVVWNRGGKNGCQTAWIWFE